MLSDSLNCFDNLVYKTLKKKCKNYYNQEISCQSFLHKKTINPNLLSYYEWKIYVLSSHIKMKRYHQINYSR